MSHISKGDEHFHDADGNHVRPAYKAPRETHSDALGYAVVKGSDVEAAERKHQRSVDAYADHIIAHQDRGDTTEED